MSTQTWLEEFSPIDPTTTPLTWTEATDIAIKAWEGRKDENLEKHKVEIEPYTACALCYKDDIAIADYCKENPDEFIDDCTFCPIPKAVGETCSRVFKSHSPARVEDMLSILHKTKEYLLTHPNYPD